MAIVAPLRDARASRLLIGGKVRLTSVVILLLFKRLFVSVLAPPAGTKLSSRNHRLNLKVPFFFFFYGMLERFQGAAAPRSRTAHLFART